MKIAIISDIHANLYALKAVAKDIVSQSIEEIYCGGDIVGYGSRPKECFDMIRTFSKGTVKGNHEDAMGNMSQYYGLNPRAQAGVKYSKDNLPKDMLEEAANLPYTFEIKEHNMVLCHGSYFEPSEFHYITSPAKARAELARCPFNICVIGHTHSPFVFGNSEGLYEELPNDLYLDKKDKFIINVGSVGQPRDGDCRASYGLFEIDEKGLITFNNRRVFYDISKTADEMVKVGLPPMLADRLFKGE